MKKRASTFITGLLSAGVFIIFQAMPAWAASESGLAVHDNLEDRRFYLLHNTPGETFGPGAEDTDLANAYSEARILHKKIRTREKKDLLIGVSLQSGIYTAAGSIGQAGPLAVIGLHVKIDGQPTYPDGVIFAKRAHTLKVELGGVVQKCTPVCSTELTYDDAGRLSGSFTTCRHTIIATDCAVSDKEIGVMLSTTSANHFNFAASGLDAGEHTIEVYAKVLSHAETNGSKRIPVFDGSGNIAGHAAGEETMETVAGVSALVKLGSLTVKEVRAADKPEKVIVAGGSDHH